MAKYAWNEILGNSLFAAGGGDPNTFIDNRERQSLEARKLAYQEQKDAQTQANADRSYDLQKSNTQLRFQQLKQNADQWKVKQQLDLYNRGWQDIGKFPGGNPKDFQVMNAPGFDPMFRPVAMAASSANPVAVQDAIVSRNLAMRGVNPQGMSLEQKLAALASSEKQVVTLDPVTGQPINTSNVPYSAEIRKGVMSPDTIKSRAVAEGEGKAITKDVEQTSKLGTAVKRLAIINKQFNEALPSGDRTPFEQRIYGNVESIKAKYGLSDNKKLLALKQNVRPIAINMIRAFGEVGNLSDTEQKGAIDVVNQAGLTDQERIEKTKQFIEFALAGARPESINLIKDRSDIKGVLDAFGVSLDGEIAAPKSGQTKSGLKYKVIE